MKRSAFAALAICLTAIPSQEGDAALVRASVVPSRANCAAFGDPLCSGGQVSGDPALDPVFNTIPNASRTALAAADKSYVDPRIGTGNSTSGSAAAAIGILRAQAAATVSSQPPLATGTINLMRLTTFSTALFEDSITVVPASPGLIGTPGFMTASLAISGQLSTGAVGTIPGSAVDPIVAYADWRVGIRVGTTRLGGTGAVVSGFFGNEYVTSTGASFAGGLGQAGMVTFTAPIVFGSPTFLAVEFAATSTVTLSAAVVQPLTSGFTLGSAESLYMSTAAWNGIDSVRSGSTVVAFTVSSISGIDYAQPVPEPRAAVLLAVGMLLLGWYARRRSLGIAGRLR